MRRNRSRWAYIGIVAVTAFSLAWGFTYAWERAAVWRRLEKEIMQDSAVLAATLQRDAGTITILVRLAPVTDLSSAYWRIHGLATKRLGPGKFRIEIEDNRNARLSAAYEMIHYYVEEAAVRGNFGSMYESSRHVLEQQGITDYRILVSNGYIFVQLSDGDRYLYQIVKTDYAERGGES